MKKIERRQIDSRSSGGENGVESVQENAADHTWRISSEKLISSPIIALWALSGAEKSGVPIHNPPEKPIFQVHGPCRVFFEQF